MYFRLAVLSGLLVQLISGQNTTWTVINRQITKDDSVFLIKGVNYSPVPPGAGRDNRTQYGDLFHSNWSHLHDRDIPLMRQAGVNSIRIPYLALTYPETDISLDHKTFFDKLYNNGDNPIYVLITYAVSFFSLLGPFDTEPTTTSYKFLGLDAKWYHINDQLEAIYAEQRQKESDIIAALAERYGSHPAVMGFAIGKVDEDVATVVSPNCLYWEYIHSVAVRVKQAAPTKLTATTTADDNFLTIGAAMQCNNLTHLDVWGINSYRGTVDQGFDTLFDQFESFTQQALLITEFGCPASTRDGTNNFIMLPENSKEQAMYAKAHWNDIVAHRSICSGGFAFSWVDEWWRLNEYHIQDQGYVRNYAFPGTYTDDESFGLVAVVVDCDKIDDWMTRVDAVLPRAAFFVMGQLFGAWSDLPDIAYLPISYPRCNGKWVGCPNTPSAATPSVPTTVIPVDAIHTPASYQAVPSVSEVLDLSDADSVLPWMIAVITIGAVIFVASSVLLGVLLWKKHHKSTKIKLAGN